MSEAPLIPALAAAVEVAAALLFGLAALSKLRQPGVFRDQIEAYGLLPTVLTWPAAILLPGLELATAVALLLDFPSGGVLAAGLLALFAAAMGVNLLRGRTEISCGCGFGAPKQGLSWGLVLRNLGIAGLLVLAIQAPPAEAAAWWLAALAGVLLFGMITSFGAVMALSDRFQPAAPSGTH